MQLINKIKNSVIPCFNDLLAMDSFSEELDDKKDLKIAQLQQTIESLETALINCNKQKAAINTAYLAVLEEQDTLKSSIETTKLKFQQNYSNLQKDYNSLWDDLVNARRKFKITTAVLVSALVITIITILQKAC